MWKKKRTPLPLRRPIELYTAAHPAVTLNLSFFILEYPNRLFQTIKKNIKDIRLYLHRDNFLGNAYLMTVASFSFSRIGSITPQVMPDPKKITQVGYYSNDDLKIQSKRQWRYKHEPTGR